MNAKGLLVTAALLAGVTVLPAQDARACKRYAVESFVLDSLSSSMLSDVEIEAEIRALGTRLDLVSDGAGGIESVELSDGDGMLTSEFEAVE